MTKTKMYTQRENNNVHKKQTPHDNNMGPYIVDGVPIYGLKFMSLENIQSPKSRSKKFELSRSKSQTTAAVNFKHYELKGLVLSLNC